MKSSFYWKIIFLSIVFHFSTYADVVVRFRGRLGNQLFQAAAGIALAEEHHCHLYFPDFEKLSVPTEDIGLMQLKENYHYIFHRLPCLKRKIIPKHVYQEPDFAYHPIPYKRHIEIVGYFLSEKFFHKYRDKIIDLFSPSEEIELYLNQTFPQIINHPNSVGIHVRTGYLESMLNGFDPKVYDHYLPPDLEYFQKAMNLFDDDALFIIFSDHIGWCKEHFTGLKKNIIFIEEQEYIYDFYLLSKCKHAIIANSSFSWWSAYLNTNPDKKIVCRMPFWLYESSSKDVPCEDWITLPMSNHPPIPDFKNFR